MFLDIAVILTIPRKPHYLSCSEAAFVNFTRSSYIPLHELLDLNTCFICESHNFVLETVNLLITLSSSYHKT